MSRCPVCGVRSCPEHGAPPSALPPTCPEEERAALEGRGFTVRGVLGVGGFGAVLEATGPDGGDPVAIKIARRDRPLGEARLRREAEAMAAIGPPHVPVFHGLHRLDDGALFLVMERLTAPTLGALLDAAPGPRPLDEVAKVAAAVLRAIEAAHRAGFVHGDLKPENVFIAPAGACLVDFGTAQHLGDADAAATRAEAPAGTPVYMAPEQCDGGRADARTDVYAMGVMLFEMLTGGPPFWGSAAELREQHTARRPPRPRELVEVPAAIDAVVLRCLAKAPADRFPGAAALAEALDAAFRGKEVTAIPASAGTGSSHDGAASGPKPRAGEAGPVSRRAPAPPEVRQREQRAVALLFFTSEAEVTRVQRCAAAHGGTLAFAAPPRFVAAFDGEAGEAPAERAVAAARALLGDGVSARALVELRTVSVQPRAGGGRRYQSPIFDDGDAYPRASDPRAVLASHAAAALLPEQGWTAVADHPGVVQLQPARGREPTTLQTNPDALLGRDEEMARLLGAAERAVAGRASLVARVIGDPGFGKSCFGQALAVRLRKALPTARVVNLAVRNPAEGSPERTRRDLAGAVLPLPGGAPRDAGRALFQAQLGAELGRRLWPGLSLALGWSAPDDAGVSALRAAPGALRAEAARALGTALAWAAERRPLVVLLDDAHLADEVTLDALEHAADAAAPVVVIALGRPAFAAARPAWGERASAREEVTLGPLAPEAAASLCRSLLRPVEDVPASAVERLVTEAQAVPLFLVELVRCLKREGAVRRHGRGDDWYLATDEIARLPELPLVDWLAQRELDAMPPDLAAHARLVSLLDAEISTAEVEGVIRVLEQRGEARELRLDAVVGVERLVAAGLLVAHEGHVSFRHALVRDAVVRSIPPELRVRLHRAAFEHHREDPGRDDEGRLAQLAHHAEGAGLHDAARDACFALAERAREKHAYLEAGALYSRALAQPDDGPEGVGRRARRGRGLVRYRLGRYDDALADLGEARALARAEGNVAAEVELLLDEATVLDWMERFQAAAARVEEAEARAAGSASPLVLARLALGLGRARHRDNREQEAAPLLARAAGAADALGDEGYETAIIARIVLGFVLPVLGRLEEAERTLDRAVAEATARADRLHLFAALNNRAFCFGYRGDKAQMIATFERMLEIARELGQPTMGWYTHYNLGEYLTLMGDRAGGAAHVDEAATIERRLFGRQGRPVAVLLQARARLHAGDVTGARAALAALHAHQAEARAHGPAEALLVPAEEVLLAAVERALDGGDDDAWAALEVRSREASVGQERIEVLELWSLGLRRAGRLAEARAVLERAVALADTMPNVLGPRLQVELAALAGLATERAAARSPTGGRR